MTDYGQVLARYKQIRGVSRNLMHRVMDYLGKGALDMAGQDLGILKNKTLILGNIDHTCVLMDHAIYDLSEGGRNAVDRYIAAHPPVPRSDQEAVLTAMRQAFFSLFLVEGVVEGVGVRVLDILRGRRHFIADVSFGQTAVPGLVLASRVLPFEEFVVTGGAALPVDEHVLEQVADYLNRLGKAPGEMDGLSAEEWADLAATVMRLALKGEGAQRIAYTEVADKPAARSAPAAGATHIGRNAPCPCGSGRKYKKCCGR